MKNTIRTLICTAVLGVTAAAPAGAAFEDVEVSPRARAMGGAFVALRQDDFAPFHNPASLASLEGRVQVATSYVRPYGYDFHDQMAAAVQVNLDRLGGVGLGVRHYGVDHLDENLLSETTVALSHGFTLLDDLQSRVSVGYSLNLYSLSFGTNRGRNDNPATRIDPGSAVTVGFDVAAQAVIQKRTRVGFYALNINNTSIGSIDEEELLRRMGMGVSYQPYPGVETVLDISTDLGEEVQFRGGTEFQVVDFLWLRAGLRTQPNIFSAGAGVRYEGLRVDYSFSTGGGTLDSTHQIGIGYVLADER